jgi:hypothetical protein
MLKKILKEPLPRSQDKIKSLTRFYGCFACRETGRPHVNGWTRVLSGKDNRANLGAVEG